MKITRWAMLFVLLSSTAIVSGQRGEDTCPNIGETTKQQKFSAEGCTEDEAKRKVLKLLIDACKKHRRDGSGKVCGKGTCVKQQEACIDLINYKHGKLFTRVRERDDCPQGVGYHAEYDEEVICNCECLPRS